MKIGNREFQTKGHTYVMGILNVTPDSFSDGGKWNDRDRALKHVEEMIAEGMDIVDIGGESTRPGYTLLSDEEEIARVVPMIEAVKANFDIPISLDTYKSGVAEAGILAGADLINDIWGLKYDNCMAEVIAKSGLPCCLKRIIGISCRMWQRIWRTRSIWRKRQASRMRRSSWTPGWASARPMRTIWRSSTVWKN